MPESELMSVAAPLSFQGSAERIWRFGNGIEGTSSRGNHNLKVAYQVLAVLFLIPTAWMFVLTWYCCFGLLLVPYRLVRRSQRNNDRDALRHRETLDALRKG